MRLGAQIGGRRPRPYDLPPKNPRFYGGPSLRCARLSPARGKTHTPYPPHSAAAGLHQSRRAGWPTVSACPGAALGRVLLPAEPGSLPVRLPGQAPQRGAEASRKPVGTRPEAADGIAHTIVSCPPEREGHTPADVSGHCPARRPLGCARRTKAAGQEGIARRWNLRTVGVRTPKICAGTSAERGEYPRGCAPLRARLW